MKVTVVCFRVNFGKEVPIRHYGNTIPGKKLKVGHAKVGESQA